MLGPRPMLCLGSWTLPGSPLSILVLLQDVLVCPGIVTHEEMVKSSAFARQLALDSCSSTMCIFVSDSTKNRPPWDFGLCWGFGLCGSLAASIRFLHIVGCADLVLLNVCSGLWPSHVRFFPISVHCKMCELFVDEGMLVPWRCNGTLNSHLNVHVQIHGLVPDESVLGP